LLYGRDDAPTATAPNFGVVAETSRGPAHFVLVLDEWFAAFQGEQASKFSGTFCELVGDLVQQFRFLSRREPLPGRKCRLGGRDGKFYVGGVCSRSGVDDLFGGRV